MRSLIVLGLVTVLVPVWAASAQTRRSTDNSEPAPVRGCLDRDLVLLANGSIHQARGAPFWVDETHQFELLGEGGMLADLEQHIGHEVDITLQLEWESSRPTDWLRTAARAGHHPGDACCRHSRYHD